MDSRKYIGMDVHQASISIAVRDANGKLVMESVIETKAATILECIRGIRGNLWVGFEEGTSAAWLYDLLKLRYAFAIDFVTILGELRVGQKLIDQAISARSPSILHAGSRFSGSEASDAANFDALPAWP